jgi:ubiquinone/menaquinone biosynthesis C-methylase UbiE
MPSALDVSISHGEFYGFDLASKMIEQSRTNSANYKGVHFSKANAEELPFENDFFDYVVCSNEFHHFSNPDNVTKEASRVLKPGEKFYGLDVTADNFLTRWLDKLGKKLEPGHVKIYSTKEYKTLFRGAGLHYMTGKSIICPKKNE